MVADRLTPAMQCTSTFVPPGLPSLCSLCSPAAWSLCACACAAAMKLVAGSRHLSSSWYVLSSFASRDKYLHMYRRTVVPGELMHVHMVLTLCTSGDQFPSSEGKERR